MSKLLLQHLHGADLIDEIQMGQVLRRIEQWGGNAVVILLQERMVEEKALVQALASHFNLPAALPLPMLIEKQALALLDPDYCSRRSVIPLALEDNGATLRLAVADPSDIELLDEIRARVGCRIRPVVSGAIAIEEALTIHFPSSASPRSSIPLPAGRSATPLWTSSDRDLRRSTGPSTESSGAEALPPMVEVHEVIHATGPALTETWHQDEAAQKRAMQSRPTVSVQEVSDGAATSAAPISASQDPTQSLLMELQLQQAAMHKEIATLTRALLAKGIVTADDLSEGED